jgi:hypothetical protein
MEQEDHAELQDANTIAELNYAATPEGQDDFAEPLESTLWLQVYNQKSGLKQPFSQKKVKVNANAVLFTAQEDDDIRAVDQSIELMGIIRDTDVDLLGGRCCEEISLLSEDAEIKNFPGPLGNQQVAVYCFSINNVNEIWTFCDEERNSIALFRNSIKEIIVSKFTINAG